MHILSPENCPQKKVLRCTVWLFWLWQQADVIGYTVEGALLMCIFCLLKIAHRKRCCDVQPGFSVCGNRLRPIRRWWLPPSTASSIPRAAVFPRPHGKPGHAVRHHAGRPGQGVRQQKRRLLPDLSRTPPSVRQSSRELL